VLSLVALVGLTLAACVPVTVNINFSQEKLDSAAKQIETTAESQSPGAARPEVRRSRTTPGLTRTPELAKVFEARRARRPQIREGKDRGCIGETRDALLASRPGDGCGGEAALIAAENADRMVVYDTFMKQNNIPPADAQKVREAFTKSRRERARPNDWIQLDDGRWVRHTP